ncbi:MAG TPA: tRNA pseudouridine(38-40) synthase TruA [Firmicutes bacterium]|nr:tRNA pseudouridine(38-40) synthase TruA [Bacillota bacterium]
MRNLLFKISYHGGAYHGFQVQKNAVAVQQVLQDGIEKVFGRREDIIGCSRTDTGVHANAYYFNMHTDSAIPCSGAVRGLNTVLPEDIAILSCTEVAEDFHARYCVREKEYIYKIWNAAVRNPFWNGLAYWHRYPLDAEKMRRACIPFIGEHDFRGFCSKGSDVEDTIRRITEMDVERNGDLLVIRVRGDGFLYNMVRIIVGTLLYVEQGKISCADLPEIIASGDRRRAGKTAPACGLYLNQVFYE